MSLKILIVLFALLCTKSLSLEADPKPISNITVMGTVFCDACSGNTFSKHSYFLEGVKVRVACKFRVISVLTEEISITVDRTTDKFGIYKLEIPPVDGFECRQGHEVESFCHASLIESPSPLCNVPSLSSSTEHVAVKSREGNVCLYNLNALNYRPSKKNPTSCGGTDGEQVPGSLNSSLFFWPPFFPPFGFPWPHWPPLPFPFPSPPSFPFPFPPIPFFTPPPSFSFPFPPIPFFTPPPSFPFPFPPLPPLPPIPPFFASPPPPPSFPFPFPPFPPLSPLPSFPPFPPFTPFPSIFTPPPPPPSPPPPAFPFPFPPLPFHPFPPTTPTSGSPSPPPPRFSLRDPRSWFPYRPPSAPEQP